MNLVLERLERIERTLAAMARQRAVKDWYSTDEVADVLDRDPFTVREWARNGRINAEKRRSGRGRYLAWVISHAELLRLQREGLLPPRQG
jgi:hypothetical protein